VVALKGPEDLTVAFGSHPSWVTSDAAIVNSYLNHAAYSTAATPCSQSQIEQDRYLLLQRTGQGEAASVLSVGVRWRPGRTAVNGTLESFAVVGEWGGVMPPA
jgi:hypothetical protein